MESFEGLFGVSFTQSARQRLASPCGAKSWIYATSMVRWSGLWVCGALLGELMRVFRPAMKKRLLFYGSSHCFAYCCCSFGTF